MPQQPTHRWDVPFGVPTSVHPVHLVFPFIFNQVGCLLALKPYGGVICRLLKIISESTYAAERAGRL